MASNYWRANIGRADLGSCGFLYLENRVEREGKAASNDFGNDNYQCYLSLGDRVVVEGFSFLWSGIRMLEPKPGIGPGT